MAQAARGKQDAPQEESQKTASGASDQKQVRRTRLNDGRKKALRRIAISSSSSMYPLGCDWHHFFIVADLAQEKPSEAMKPSRVGGGHLSSIDSDYGLLHKAGTGKSDPSTADKIKGVFGVNPK